MVRNNFAFEIIPALILYISGCFMSRPMIAVRLLCGWRNVFLMTTSPQWPTSSPSARSTSVIRTITLVHFPPESSQILFNTASPNVIEVAVRNGLWSPSSGKPFHFARAYGTDIHHEAQACTRRIWLKLTQLNIFDLILISRRIFTLAAPSLIPIFSPFTDSFSTFGYGSDGSDPYPFSVKPDRPLTIQVKDDIPLLSVMNRLECDGYDSRSV